MKNNWPFLLLCLVIVTMVILESVGWCDFPPLVYALGDVAMGCAAAYLLKGRVDVYEKEGELAAVKLVSFLAGVVFCAFLAAGLFQLFHL